MNEGNEKEGANEQTNEWWKNGERKERRVERKNEWWVDEGKKDRRREWSNEWRNEQTTELSNERMDERTNVYVVEWRNTRMTKERVNERMNYQRNGRKERNERWKDVWYTGVLFSVSTPLWSGLLTDCIVYQTLYCLSVLTPCRSTKVGYVILKLDQYYLSAFLNLARHGSRFVYVCKNRGLLFFVLYCKKRYENFIHYGWYTLFTI